MRVIDLHDFNVNEAMEFFLKICLEEQKSSHKKIKVIHGYGSNGEGGKIKKVIRNYIKLNKNYFDIITGEEIDLNQGYSIVIIKKSIEEIDSILDMELLKFCETGKSLDKIVGKFRKYGEKNILQSIKKLMKKSKIKESIKGKYKYYEVIIE